MNISPAQFRVLRRAAGRDGHYVCPTPGIYAAAQELVLRSLERRGLIKYPVDFNLEEIQGIPVLSGCGLLFAANDAIGAR